MKKNKFDTELLDFKASLRLAMRAKREKEAKMWDITNQSPVSLPNGFRLVECNDYSLLLFCGEKKVADFSSLGVTPKEIEKAAEEYLREHERVG